MSVTLSDFGQLTTYTGPLFRGTVNPGQELEETFMWSAGMMDDVEGLCTSTNPEVIDLFGQGSGFIFEVSDMPTVVLNSMTWLAMLHVVSGDEPEAAAAFKEKFPYMTDRFGDIDSYKLCEIFEKMGVAAVRFYAPEEACPQRDEQELFILAWYREQFWEQLEEIIVA